MCYSLTCALQKSVQSWQPFLVLLPRYCYHTWEDWKTDKLRKTKNNQQFEDEQGELHTAHFNLLKVPVLFMWHSLHLIINLKVLIHSDHVHLISGINTVYLMLHLESGLPSVPDQGWEAWVPKERKLLPGFSVFAEPIGLREIINTSAQWLLDPAVVEKKHNWGQCCRSKVNRRQWEPFHTLIQSCCVSKSAMCNGNILTLVQKWDFAEAITLSSHSYFVTFYLFNFHCCLMLVI